MKVVIKDTGKATEVEVEGTGAFVAHCAALLLSGMRDDEIIQVFCATMGHDYGEDKEEPFGEGLTALFRGVLDHDRASITVYCAQVFEQYIPEDKHDEVLAKVAKILEVE